VEGKTKKTGRNDPCPCGSGIKYKKCCMRENERDSLPRIRPQKVIDEKAQTILKSHFNLHNGFLVRELPEDYGIDYQVELINSNSQTSGISFCVQLKGTDNIKIKGGSVAVQLKKSTLHLFSRQLYPVILVFIDTLLGKGYWHNSFDFIDELDDRIPLWRSQTSKTAVIHVPVCQDFSAEQLIRLRNYVEDVHKRRNAIPQGYLSLSQPFEGAEGILNIGDLKSIVDSHDFVKFFHLVATNPFGYLSNINFSALYDIFQEIPPIKLEKHADAMATFSMACFYKGYHQEARKWSHRALSLGIDTEELAVQIEYVINVIDFIYKYKSEKDFLIELDNIENRSSKEMKVVTSIQKIRIDYINKEEQARKYGRYRQKKVIEDTINKLWKLGEDSLENCHELILLEIATHYSTLAPFYCSEIAATPQFHQKLNLDLPESNFDRLLKDAETKFSDGVSVFNELINPPETRRVSLYTKAEALLEYGMYKYNLQSTEFVNLIFLQDRGALPADILLVGKQRDIVEQSLNYFTEAEQLFEMIGVADRGLVALIEMLACFEDLGEKSKYKETKDEIDDKIKTVLVPNTLELYEEIIREGSPRTRMIKNIRDIKPPDDFDKANMDDAAIEMQVECNCKTFNISEENRIENVRKDVISYILASKYRINVCKHFELYQDKRHTFSRNTFYNIDPNRKGICRVFNYESKTVQCNSELVIDSFNKTFCKNCLNKEPLEHS